MNLNDFSKWLQYNRVKHLRGSEYFPYPLYIYMCVSYIYIYTLINKLTFYSICVIFAAYSVKSTKCPELPWLKFFILLIFSFFF